MVIQPPLHIGFCHHPGDTCFSPPPWERFFASKRVVPLTNLSDFQCWLSQSQSECKVIAETPFFYWTSWSRCGASLNAHSSQHGQIPTGGCGCCKLKSNSRDAWLIPKEVVCSATAFAITLLLGACIGSSKISVLKGKNLGGLPKHGLQNSLKFHSPKNEKETYPYFMVCYNPHITG